MVQPVILTANDSCILSISPEKANIASQLGFILILSCMMGTGQERAFSLFAIVYIYKARAALRWDVGERCHIVYLLPTHGPL